MKIDPLIKPKVEQLFSKPINTLSTALGIEFLNLSKQSVSARMPVDNRTKQPFGILHGGASVALAETVASIGAWLNIDEQQFDAVGIEINANHLRSVSNGFVTGEAKPIHLGRTTHVWEISIASEDGKLVCISRCTLAVRPKNNEK